MLRYSAIRPLAVGLVLGIVGCVGDPIEPLPTAPSLHRAAANSAESAAGVTTFTARAPFLQAATSQATLAFLDFATDGNGNSLSAVHGGAYAPRTIGGVRLSSFFAYSDWFIYTYPNDLFRVDLPPGTHAFGIHMHPFYDPQGTTPEVTLSTGEKFDVPWNFATWPEFTYFGVVTSRPIEWVTIRLAGTYLQMDDITVAYTTPPADATPPQITPVVTAGAPAGTGGWYTSDVQVEWTVADAESEITARAGCDAVLVRADTDADGRTFICTATSAGGTASRSVTVRRDATPPSVTPALAGTPGTGGWYRSDVGVSWSLSDDASGIASSTGCAPVTAATDGSVTYTCTATNRAGLSATGRVTVQRDATSPLISFAGNAGTYTVDQTVTIQCTATDATSGIDSSTCPAAAGAAYTFALGQHTLTASATDRAGNVGTASTGFTVSVTSAGLCALTTRFSTKPGVAVALCHQLAAAAAAASQGNAEAKAGAIGAYINEVRAQTGKAFTGDQAQLLARLAEAL